MLAAAITLARAGRDVTLIDKAGFPRDKCCGDGLTTLALRELEGLGFDPSMVDDWQVVDGAVLRSPSGREVVVPLPRSAGTFAAVVPRLQLDASLVDLAAKAGADVVEGCGFDGRLDQRVDRVVVGLGGSARIDARYVIGADGMWSPVRKAAGLGVAGYLGEWHAFRAYARDVDGAAAEHLHVWFDADLLPGYAWSFPLPGGRANVGFGVLRDGDGPARGRAMKEQWSGLLDRPHIRAGTRASHAVLDGRHLAWPIPARVDQVSLGTGRVLLAGDAAAASDVMTGEGIGQALLTGRLAADAVLAAGGAVTSAGPASVRACRARRARRRSPDVRRPRSCAQPPPRRTGGDRHPRPRRGPGAAQLRPLDVRGRAPRRAAHATSLAPPPARPRGRLDRDTVIGQAGYAVTRASAIRRARSALPAGV